METDQSYSQMVTAFVVGLSILVGLIVVSMLL